MMLLLKSIWPSLLLLVVFVGSVHLVTYIIRRFQGMK